VAHRNRLPKLKHTFEIFLSVERRAVGARLELTNITKSDFHMDEILRLWNPILNL
jgi:hypothetical protein